jgi:ABC-type transport system involved in multi-copper enzyme maturation permease subunit
VRFPQVLNIVKEHFAEKKWSFLLFGCLVGLLGYGIILIMNQMNFAQLSQTLSGFPKALIAWWGGIANATQPYGFFTSEVFSFTWLYMGIYLVYMASSTGLPQEVEDQTLDLVLSKPIRRTTYLAGKILFLFAFLAGTLAIVMLIIAVGMGTSPAFQSYGLYWNRLGGVYLITLLHLGTLITAAVFFGTIFLSVKRTLAAALALMFFMYFLGTFWQYFPASAQGIKYVTTWFYYNPMEVFGQGIFNNLIRNTLVLSGFNAAFIVASLLIFRKRDIPV